MDGVVAQELDGRTMTPLWDSKRERLAELLAEGVLTEAQCAQVCNLRVPEARALSAERWFVERVDSLRAEASARSLRLGVATREFRLGQLNQRHALLQRVVRERAASADPESEFYVEGAERVPGAATGLLARKLRVIGQGPSAQVVEDWELDSAALKAFDAVEAAAAAETGGRVHRAQVDVTQKLYVGIDVGRV